MKRFFVCLVLLMWGLSAHGVENPPSTDLKKKDAGSSKKQEMKENPLSSFKKKSPKKPPPHLQKDNKDGTEWIYEQKEGC